MGIRFLDSLLILAAAAAVVFSAYFVGHALSNGAGWAWLTAAGLLVLGGALGFLTSRRVRSFAREHGETPRM